MSHNTVRAGNMLNEILVAESGEPFIARVAVWIAYYSLMPALAKCLDHFERTIEKRHEPVRQQPAPEGWVPATIVE